MCWSSDPVFAQPKSRSCRVDVGHDADRAQETLAVAAVSETLRCMTERHLATIQVVGQPASFATAHEKPWKDAVRSAVAAAGVQPQDARFAVRMEFRVAVSQNANEVWDLDNLIKPTLDAMEGVFGTRLWKGPSQAADDRVDRLQAVKRLPHEGELIGAIIDVWVILPD
jgi:Holliday junction resolvase RusA-like endonuclease